MKRVFFFFFIGFTACNFDQDQQKTTSPVEISIDLIPVYNDSTKYSFPKEISVAYSSTEQSIIDAGLIDIKSIDSTIIVDLKYSTTDNFLGLDVYGTFNTCYLQPGVAEKLKTAQQLLRSKFPYYSLVVYDAARPRSIQYKMWDTINVPLLERSKYLSNPKNGSLHNFGAAVDVSIMDENGYALDMGTPYDYFGELAYPREEERLNKEGKLTRIQLLNRELLRTIMTQAGFKGITTEWWHFNSCDRPEAFSRYNLIE
ncbi:MAG: M15 family metallopeptidase [Bacteroidota bacterium]